MQCPSREKIIVWLCVLALAAFILYGSKDVDLCKQLDCSPAQTIGKL
jgi:hypothetical protein